MLPRFLFPPIERLSADGSLSPVDGPSSERRTPVVLLARELCAFEYFRPPSGPGAADAAELRSRQAAPFVNPGVLVRRQGSGFAIWWWDLDVVQPLLARRFNVPLPRLLPASLAQPGGEGWRIVRSAPGFEAQVWRDGVLQASAWRRQPFDDEAWSAFTRVQRDLDPPPHPPAAQSLPFDWIQVRAALTSAITARQAAIGAAAAVAAVMVLSTAFLLGQGLRLADETRRLLAETARIPSTAGLPVSADARRNTSWRALARKPDPVVALARAMGVAELYGATPTAFSADHNQVRLTLPYSALSALNRIALELRDTGLFSEIRPSPDNESQTIDVRLTLVGADPVNPAE